MIRPLLVHILCFSTLFCSAQIPSLYVNDNVDRFIWEQSFKKPDFSFHSAFRGYDRVLHVDTTVFRTPKFFRRSVSPLLDLTGVAINDDSLNLSSRAIVGLGWSAKFGKRWEIDLAAMGGSVMDPSFSELHTQSSEIIEGYGKGNGPAEQKSFWDVNGSVRFQASPQFRLELGKAKHFIGDGYRSVFLSDNSSPYPYLRIDTKVWHIQYMNLYSWQQGMLHPNGKQSTFENKFTTTHLLSWNVSELFNVQLFETIIWQGKDSLSNRGFDVAYLNPIIFYRPVEFASGSADNAILGIAASVKVWPRFQWYTQIAIDEFLLSEFTNKTGWWGNKYAFQIGLKGREAMRINGLYTQVELNLARPFTYSHGSPIQSYTHLNQSLAHPLGANFYEFLMIAAYNWKKWECRGQFTYTKRGLDKFGLNLGGDIFRSYVNPFQNFNNVIGQGLLVESYRTDIRLSWIIDPAKDTRIQLGYEYDYFSGDVNQKDVHSIQVSIRSSLGDGYR